MAKTATLSCTAGKWYLTIAEDGATLYIIRVRRNDAMFEGTFGDPVEVTVEGENPCADSVIADVVYGTVRSRCFCNGAVFGIGKPAVCAGEKDAGGCSDLARFRVELDCCPIEGWGGPGDYCVSLAEGDPIAVTLTEADRCATSIEIVSGPHPPGEAPCDPLVYDVECDGPEDCEAPNFAKVTITGLTPAPIVLLAPWMTRSVPDVPLGAAGTGYHIDKTFDVTCPGGTFPITRLVGRFDCKPTYFAGVALSVNPELSCEPTGQNFDAEHIGGNQFPVPGSSTFPPLGLVTDLAMSFVGTVRITVEDPGAGDPDCAEPMALFQSALARPAQQTRETATAAPVRRGPCAHRSAEPVRSEVCDSCGGKVQLKVFACSEFGECTVAKPLKGVAGCCKGCAKYEAAPKG